MAIYNFLPRVRFDLKKEIIYNSVSDSKKFDCGICKLISNNGSRRNPLFTTIHTIFTLGGIINTEEIATYL